MELDMSTSTLSVVNTIMVPLAQIRADEAAQTRARVRGAVVRQYAAAMTEQIAEGDLHFPPIIVFTDGREYWLGDGFHRVGAAQKAGLTELAAEVRPGTKRDALLYGISANIAHGLPRTRADRRRSVALLLADAEWSQWSDREIARRCQVGHALVSRMRHDPSVSKRQIAVRKAERGGTIYEIKTAPHAAADAATSAHPAQAPADAAPLTDTLGIPLPESRAKVFAAWADFQEAKELFDRLAAVLDRIAREPAGDLYRVELVWTAKNGQAAFACPALRTCRARLLAAEPYCSYCPNCCPPDAARPYPACKICGGRGWTTRAAFDSCRESDRQRILNKRLENAK
jgi:hypothetical protein